MKIYPRSIPIVGTKFRFKDNPLSEYCIVGECVEEGIKKLVISIKGGGRCTLIKKYFLMSLKERTYIIIPV